MRVLTLIRPIFYFTIGIALLATSCNDGDLATDVSVFTEEVVFASGEMAVMTGRVLAQGEVAIEDHGFQIDTDENFPNPLVLALGEKTIPGRFVGQTAELDIHLDYFCRAYITTGDETTFGNVLPFSTLSPKALDFTPKEGNPGTTIIIEGRNLTADTKVIWNDETVITPLSITAETLVEFEAPALTDDPSIDLKLVSQGDTSVLNEPFEYIIGTWENLGTLTDPFKNTRHIFFEDGDDFIYGLGIANNILSPEVHILDKNSLQRNTILFPGTPVEGAFFHSKYFGGGSVKKVFSPNEPLDLSSQFWKYENQGFVQLPDFPNALYKAACLVANDKVYVYGGESISRVRVRSVYVFDTQTETWGTLSDAPISPLGSLPAFHLDGYNYFVLEDGTTHRHDPASDTWDTMAAYPKGPKEFGFSLILNDQAYVGMQGTDRGLFVYRPWNDTWRTKKSLPEILLFTMVGAWENDGKIFVSRVKESESSFRDLWSFDPDDF